MNVFELLFRALGYRAWPSILPAKLEDTQRLVFQDDKAFHVQRCAVGGAVELLGSQSPRFGALEDPKMVFVKKRPGILITEQAQA